MPYRQDRTVRLVALIGLGLTVLVFVANVLGLPLMRILSGNSGVTTLWTAATFALLFAYFRVQSRVVERALLVAAMLVQMASVGLLLTESFAKARWLVPSSNTTTLFLALAIGALAARNLPWRWLTRGLFSALAPLPLLFAWAARNHHLHYLGVRSDIPGLGMSSTTIFLGMLLVACAHLACFRVVGINARHRQIEIWRPLLILLTAQLVAGMVLPLGARAADLLVMGLDLVSFGALYYLLTEGRFEDRDNAVTVCAWTQRVRVSDGRWLKLDEFLTEAGFQVTHGMHPDVDLATFEKGQHPPTPPAANPQAADNDRRSGEVELAPVDRAAGLEPRQRRSIARSSKTAAQGIGAMPEAASTRSK